MRVRVLARAQGDLLEVSAYLKKENPRARPRVIARLLNGIDQLAQLPSSAPLVKDEALAVRGFRCLHRSGYAIFYKVKGNTVFVHRVLHHRRQWAGLL